MLTLISFSGLTIPNYLPLNPPALHLLQNTQDSLLKSPFLMMFQSPGFLNFQGILLQGSSATVQVVRKPKAKITSKTCTITPWNSSWSATSPQGTREEWLRSTEEWESRIPGVPSFITNSARNKPSGWPTYATYWITTTAQLCSESTREPSSYSTPGLWGDSTPSIS